MPAARPIIQRKVEATSFLTLMQEQTLLQQHVMRNPGDYAGKLVTVGFEHEFGSMIDDNLKGISHLQLAESTNRMPYRDLPFYLETDADKAIEMVDPPFLVETVEEGVPIPHPVDIDIIMRLIESRLYSLIQGFPTLNGFIQHMRSDPGIDFQVSAVQIEPMHLSHATTGDYTEGPTKDVSSPDLLRLRLGPSDKYNGTVIASQINFATTAKTYEKIKSFNPAEPAGKFLNTARHMAAFITGGMIAENEGQNIFISQLNRVLTEQMAVPFMEEMRAGQKMEFEGGAKIRDNPAAFRTAATLTSKIKDVNRVWIKDSLMSIGAGLLRDEDWSKISKQLIGALEKAAGMIPEESTDLELLRYYEAGKKSMIAMLIELKTQIDSGRTKPDSIYAPPKEPSFLEHDPKLLGARQDTYIAPDKVQMPGIWDRQRLHVVETRANGPRTIAQIANNDPTADQVVEDRRVDPSRGFKGYNILKHAYFKPADKNDPEGKSVWYDPVSKDERPIVNDPNRTRHMHYNPTIKMYFDPSMGLYWDDDRQAYYDQGLAMYYQPSPQRENSYYYSEDVKMRFNPDSKMYEDASKKKYYDPVRRAWVNPDTKEATFIHIASFTNPTQKIAYDPTSKAKDSRLLLKDIYPNYLRITAENTEKARILKTIGDIEIPHDTLPANMAGAAIGQRFGDSVTLRQVYFDFAGITANPQEAGARKLKDIGDTPIPSTTPPEQMVMTAYAEWVADLYK